MTTGLLGLTDVSAVRSVKILERNSHMAYPGYLGVSNAKRLSRASSPTSELSKTAVSDGKGKSAARKTNPLQSLFTPIIAGVGRVAPSGRWVAASATLCRMLGYDRAVLLSRTAKDVTHPDDWSKEEPLIRSLIDGDENSYKIEKRYISRTGLCLSVNETSSAVRDVDGSFLSRICLIEVDQRKHMETLFRLAVETSTNAIVLADQSGKTVLANAQTERIFGYSSVELIGKTVEIIVPGFLRKHLTTSAFGEDRIPSVEKRWDSYSRRKDGTYFPAELSLRPVATHQGTWSLISIVDITERRRAESISPQSKLSLQETLVEVQQ